MRRNSRFPTKIMLLIRVAIGGYLLYLCYSLYQTRDAGSISPALLAIILAVFVICAIAVIAHSAYLFMNGMYEGGSADIEVEDADADGADVSDDPSNGSVSGNDTARSGNDADEDAGVKAIGDEILRTDNAVDGEFREVEDREEK
ncbi:MAG: hypothetical protein IKR47_00985 [Lachnospiraceae bacterium]|nr:hypothetical protein [Lachnospiraceae bacterium]